ncbi:MAG: TolC family outer membrane protein [Rhodospirillales bacterium]|nr:TolC family outer membrane protein [Rhodospirillales bacterium]
MLGAPDLRAQSLNGELEGLLVSHPEIRAGERSAQAADEGVRRAFSGYLPKLDIFGESGPQYIDSPVLKSQGGGAWSTIAQVAGAQLTQKVFDGFATPSQIRSARLNLEVAEFTLAGTVQAVLFEGISAYIEVLRQNRLVDLARESETTIMHQLRLEDERVQRGSGIAVDVLQAKSRLQVAKERRVGFEGGLADATTRYIQVFGHPPEIGAMTAPQTPTGLLPGDLAQTLELARQENPAIDSSLANVAIADEKKRLVRSEYYPTLDIVARADRENDNDLVQGTRTDASVVLSARWNLFSGFSTAAGLKQAGLDYKVARENHDLLARKLDEETRLAWNDWATARRRVELLDNAVAIASEVFDARHKLREAGRETVINVLDAENEVYNARISLTQASGDETLSAFRLLQAVGRLRPEDLGLSQP